MKMNAIILMMIIMMMFMNIIIVKSDNILIKKDEQLLSTQKFKFMFMLKYQTVKNEKQSPLNVLSYKNVFLSTSQVVFFISSNPSISVSY